MAYLEEENEDALERITLLQGEIKALKEGLARAHQEKDQALGQIQTLEDKIEQNDILRIKGRLKEREVSHFSEENQELRLRLGEALAQNMELEKKYEVLKRSFNEVKDSLTLLRDACKANYYNYLPIALNQLHEQLISSVKSVIINKEVFCRDGVTRNRPSIQPRQVLFLRRKSS